MFDRGARDGGGIFETVRVYGGRPFAWERHMERLVLSARPSWASRCRPRRARCARRSAAVLAAEGLRDAVVRITVTRGIAGGRPTRAGAWVEAEPLGARLWRGHAAGAARAIVLARCRSSRAGSARHKTTSRLAWDLAREEARAAGVDEALLVSPAGEVLEGAASNLFVVRDDERAHAAAGARHAARRDARDRARAVRGARTAPAREATLSRAALGPRTRCSSPTRCRTSCASPSLDGRARGDTGVAARLLAAYRELVAAATSAAG